jgi:hypothetical protein
MQWGEGLDAQLPLLAEMLGVEIYDLRLRLRGSLPVVVARFEDTTAAASVGARLLEWGHQVVTCDLDHVPTVRTKPVVRDFEVELGAIKVVEDGGTIHRVEGSEIVCLVQAVVTSETVTEGETKQKKFSASRAALTGGLMMSKTTTVRTRQTSESAEQRLYVFRSGGLPVVLFQQGRVRFGGLGDRVGHSSLESFRKLVEVVRGLTDAPFDDRLVSSRPKGAQSSFVVNHGKGTTTVVQSGEAAVDLAAYMMAVSHSLRPG